MYTEFQQNLKTTIETLRQENGTFRASHSEEYNATWIRDNFWNNLSYLNHEPEKYLQCCHTHLDFLKLYEFNYDHKLAWLIREPDVYGERSKRFIHPKVNFDGTEIEGLQWQFLQLDTLAYYLLMFWYGVKNGLEVFRDKKDKYVVQLLIKIIEKLDICNKVYAHSWEEETAIFTSNLGLCMRALEVSYEMGFEVSTEELRRIRRKFYGQFPLERHGRECDLTLLFLTVIDGILKPIDTIDTIQQVSKNLYGEFGIKRYCGDIYKPFVREYHCCDWKQPCKEEMQWPMGYGYIAIAYAKMGEKEIAKHYIEKLYKAYPNGQVPEGVNEKGEQCVNSPLCWSCSMTSLAIDALNSLFV